MLLLLLSACGSSSGNEQSAGDNNSVSLEEYNSVVAERDYYKEQYEKLIGSGSSETTTQMENPESEFMAACRNTEQISLWLGVNTQSISGEKGVYSLSLKDDHSWFQYLDKDIEPFSGDCDFSADKYYELRDLLCSTELHEYKPAEDANGKLIYEDVDCMISISLGSSKGSVFVADPSNKDEIVAFFNALLKSSLE